MKDSRGDRKVPGGDFLSAVIAAYDAPLFAAPRPPYPRPRGIRRHTETGRPRGDFLSAVIAAYDVTRRDLRRSPPSRPPRRPNPQPRGIRRHTETGRPRGDFLSAVIATYDAPLRGPAASLSSAPASSQSSAPRRPASRGEAPRRSPVPRSVLRGAAGSVDVSPLPRSPDFSAVRCQHRRMPAPKRPMPEDSARRTKKPPFRRRRRCCGSERRSMRIFVPPEREGEGPEKKAGTSAQGLRRHAQAARTIKN